MTDFKYESPDLTSMKVAFEGLRKAEESGFWVGTILGLPLGYLLYQRLAKAGKILPSRSKAVTIPLLTGSILYWFLYLVTLLTPLTPVPTMNTQLHPLIGNMPT